MKVRVGTTEVSYAVKDGDSQDDVVKGLNAAFASAGFSLQATNTGTGVQIATNEYGSGASFDVDWGARQLRHHKGVDIAGTINGVAATGSGQQLLVPFADNTLSGLALKITNGVTGDLGELHVHAGSRPARPDRDQ